MIQILSGQVKYKDRNDYLVEYSNIGDTQYYITNKLKNGNFVTTTVLKEAIHEEMNPTSFGVINSEGEIVIECNNKAINPSGEDYLIIESVNPENETVKEMASLQNDPLNANKIVSLRAELKESLTNAMNGDNGNLEFANPCSEATVCDINGQNIVNNETYSYIGRGDSGFYLRKVDSPAVVKYDFATNSLSNLGEEQEVNPMDAPLTPQVPIVEESVEGATNEVPTEEAVAPEAVEQEVSEAPVEAQESVETQALDTTEEVAPVEEVATEEVPTEDAVAPEAVEQEVSEAPVEEVSEEVVDEEVVPETTEEVPTEDVVETTEETEENTDLNIANVEVDKEQIENEINDSETEEVEEEKYSVDLDKYDHEPDKKHSYFDSSLRDEDIKDAFSKAEEETDSLFPDVLRKTRELVSDNQSLAADNKSMANEIRDLKETLRDAQAGLRDAEDNLRNAEDLNRVLKSKVVEFKDKISDLDQQNEHLNRANDKMEAKNMEQQETIEKLKEENYEWKRKFQESTERHDRWREEFKKVLNYDSKEEDPFSKIMAA